MRVLHLDLLLEREVLGQVAALVVAAQQEERARVAELERQQVQNALHTRLRVHSLYEYIHSPVCMYPFVTYEYIHVLLKCTEHVRVL